MSNILGTSITLTLFGESHGDAVGGVIDGVPAGLEIDEDHILREMNKRKSLASISTPRKEEDIPLFLSGVKNGRAEGTPLAFMIPNRNVKSSDYGDLEHKARPGHADYAAEMRYDGFQDPAGGGHFSGRLTAPIVCAGAIFRKALEAKGIVIASHISELSGIRDRSIDWDAPEKDAKLLDSAEFPVLSEEAGQEMILRIREARDEGDSVGGILETFILGAEPGIGEPFFAGMESEIARAVFSVGGVKGIEFGAGFGFAGMRGSEANDPFAVRDGRIVTLTNNNGGLNGGITNGMPIVFRTAVKPTPSISKPQRTVDFRTMEEAEIEIRGRHDPAIIHRARAVIDALAAFITADMIALRHGRGWLV